MQILQLILSQLKKIPRSYYLPILIAIAGLSLFTYGLTQYFHNSLPNEKITDAQNSEKSEDIKIVKSIIIDVSGAVLHPGVYKLEVDSRIKDALLAAGGFSADADKSYIEKQINLASKVSDGMKIYIPRIGEKQSVMGASDSSGNTESMNINTVSSATLEKLSGIGPVTAEKIISNRPYTRVEELLEKKVLSKSVYEKIKNQIRVY